MDEFKFVIKCLVLTCLLFAVSQIKTDNGLTIEAHLQSFLVSSSVANFVNESAQGGVVLIRKSYEDSEHAMRKFFAKNSREEQRQIVRNPSTKKTNDNSDFKQSRPQTEADDFDLYE